MPRQRGQKRWKPSAALLAPVEAINEFLNSRVMNIIYPVMLIIIGWVAVTALTGITKTQDCFRDYIIEDSNASQPRLEANGEKDDAIAVALTDLGNLFTLILANQGDASAKAEKEALDVFTKSQRSLEAFEEKNKELAEARAEYPPPPAPQNLCRNP